MGVCRGIYYFSHFPPKTSIWELITATWIKVFRHVPEIPNCVNQVSFFLGGGWGVVVVGDLKKVQHRSKNCMKELKVNIYPDVE